MAMDSRDSEEKAAPPPPPAPFLQIPSRAISVVEHPCIIKNIDKGLLSLGGPVKLSKGLTSRLDPIPNPDPEAGDDAPDILPNILSVSLRPDDPLAKRLLATPVPTNNLLLKFTVPKRTGRRRKRGSSAPFEPYTDTPQGPEIQNAHVDAATVFRTLQDNADKYTVSVAGLIDETHRFRSLPDIQYAASTNPTMQMLREHVLPLSFSKLKSMDLNTAPGPDLTRHVAPSAEFIQSTVQHNYRFQQNMALRFASDGGGEVAEVNLNKSIAWLGYHIIKPNAESVPTEPRPSLPAETDLSPYVQDLIGSIRRELDARPIITRHLLYNTLGWDKRDRLREACVYCGYFFESGPWREALIAWGVDPRKDPKYRFFQTISFLSYNSTGIKRHFKHFDVHTRNMARKRPDELRNQHTFDGVNVSHTGNLFQFCDITDPLIQRILHTKDFRSTCSPTMQGWFHVGTWAKATVILKDKMNKILAGEKPDDSIYQRILTWPELWDDETFFAQYYKEFTDKNSDSELTKEHRVMRTVRYAARNPRYAFEQLERLHNQRNNPEAETEEVDDETTIDVDMTEVPEKAEDILNEGDDSDEGEDEFSDEDDDDSDDDEDAVYSDDEILPGERMFDMDGNEILAKDWDEEEADAEFEAKITRFSRFSSTRESGRECGPWKQPS